MMITSKEQIKPGDSIYIVNDNRPIDSAYMVCGTVTEVFEDHYLYRDHFINKDNVWGLYDNEPGDSIVIFSTETDADEYLNKLQRGM